MVRSSSPTMTPSMHHRSGAASLDSVFAGPKPREAAMCGQSVRDQSAIRRSVSAPHFGHLNTTHFIRVLS
jgi:hypothetical protein